MQAINTLVTHQLSFTCSYKLNLIVDILAGGTGMGHVMMWKYNPHAGSKVEPEDRWKLQPPSTIEGPIGQICVRLKLINIRL